MADQPLLRENMTSRVRWLMLMRVAIISFLLGIATFSEFKAVTMLPEESLTFFYMIIVATYSFSFLYLVFLALIPNIAVNIYIQAICDILLITYTVYVTGGTVSIYSVFYPLVIIYSVLFLGRSGAFFIASLCGIFYGTLLNLEYYDVIHPMYVTSSEYHFRGGYVLTRIFTHILSFYIIAFLASFVVEQEKRVRALLVEKESAFDELDLLHKSIVESVNLGILTTNLQGKINSFNKAAQDITEYGLSDVEGRNILEIFPVYGEMRTRRNTLAGVTGSRFEMVFQTKQNKAVVLGCSLSPLKNNHGATMGEIMIFQDLTAIKKIEENYERSRRMAFIGEMAARLAHEIRNPLASISGSIQMLSRDLHLPESDKKLMNIILRGKEQLESFIKDFLRLARPVPGIPEIVDSREIVEDVLDSIQYVPDWHEGIEFHKSLADSVTLYANRSEIRQIIWNLILNALQAMPAGGRLTVRTDKKTSDEFLEYLEMVITDTGSGIPENELANIYEPFYTTKERGTGLGLAIVNRIVETIKGKISISSKPGVGTQCIVLLPLTAAEKDSQERKNG